MADPKGDLLYVNLNASQVRRRLKGFGHGVRKVQSGGRNRAVIIHTATGKNLSELQRLFADVGCSAANDLGEPIENLRNLGSQNASRLRDAGILTVEALDRLGAVSAFRQVRCFHPDVSLDLLWALQAGLQNRDWQELSAAERERLTQELAVNEPPS